MKTPLRLVLARAWLALFPVVPVSAQQPAPAAVTRLDEAATVTLPVFDVSATKANGNSLSPFPSTTVRFTTTVQF